MHLHLVVSHVVLIINCELEVVTNINKINFKLKYRPFNLTVTYKLQIQL